MTGATTPRQYPQEPLPELAFAGRSNVGKSSLINSLLNRKKLVKTSSTPGKTQMINFFKINDEMIFADLPGYGFAKVPLDVKKRWQKMIEQYLLKRETLIAVVLIVDIRRNPTQLDLGDRLYLYRHQSGQVVPAGNEPADPQDQRIFSRRHSERIDRLFQQKREGEKGALGQYFEKIQEKENRRTEGIIPSPHYGEKEVVHPKTKQAALIQSWPVSFTRFCYNYR